MNVPGTASPLDPHMAIKKLEHVGIVVKDLAAAIELFGELVRYEDSYRLCYVGGPEGIIVELAEKITLSPQPPSD